MAGYIVAGSGRAGGGGNVTDPDGKILTEKIKKCELDTDKYINISFQDDNGNDETAQVGNEYCKYKTIEAAEASGAKNVLAYGKNELENNLGHDNGNTIVHNDLVLNSLKHNLSGYNLEVKNQLKLNAKSTLAISEKPVSIKAGELFKNIADYGIQVDSGKLILETDVINAPTITAGNSDDRYIVLAQQNSELNLKSKIAILENTLVRTNNSAVAHVDIDRLKYNHDGGNDMLMYRNNSTIYARFGELEYNILPGGGTPALFWGTGTNENTRSKLIVRDSVVNINNKRDTFLWAFGGYEHYADLYYKNCYFRLDANNTSCQNWGIFIKTISNRASFYHFENCRFEVFNTLEGNSAEYSVNELGGFFGLHLTPTQEHWKTQYHFKDCVFWAENQSLKNVVVGNTAENIVQMYNCYGNAQNAILGDNLTLSDASDYTYAPNLNPINHIVNI